MTTSQQSALASGERIQGYVKQMMKEFGLFNLSGFGLLALTTVAIVSWKKDISPEFTIASGLGAFGCFCASLIELSRMAKIQKMVTKETKHYNSSVIISPLKEKLPLEKKKALSIEQSGMTPPQLTSGQPNLGSTVIKKIAVNNDLTSTANTRQRAIEFVMTTLLNLDIKGIDPKSHKHRTNLLDRLGTILAAPPTSSGLTLTEQELNFLIKIVEIGAITEKAPETMSEYLKLFKELIESYIFSKRINLVGKTIVNDLVGQAIQAENLTGFGVSPPIGVWKEAQKLIEEEIRVALNEDQVIDIAKSAIALGNSRIPEVRETFMKTFPDVETILINEKKRIERTEIKDTNYLATINTVLLILRLSIDVLIDPQNLNRINEISANRLAGKQRITPRDIIDEFERSEFGSFSMQEDSLIIRAKNIFFADILTCAAAICFPHVPKIEIYVGMDNQEPVQSAVISTGVFYSHRLLLKEKNYIAQELKLEQEKMKNTGSEQSDRLLATSTV